MHGENGPLLILFGLLFWGVFFAPRTANAFCSPWQDSRPAHINASAVEQRLQRIMQGGAPGMVAAAWNAHQGEQCRGVSWRQYSREQLVLWAAALGGRTLCSLCRAYLGLGLARATVGGGDENGDGGDALRAPAMDTISTDGFSLWSGGVPDLLVWRPQGAAGGGATAAASSASTHQPLHERKHELKFVEVKGPSDKLSDRQRAWIDMLLRSGASVEVHHVAWAGHG